MKGYSLLRTISQWILPFVILFGLSLVLNGDLSPGGGFQGGVVLASCYILIYFIRDEKTFEFYRIIRYEKILFLALLIVGGFSLVLWSPDLPQAVKIADLIILNTIIGLKVTLGFWSILFLFTEEGQGS